VYEQIIQIVNTTIHSEILKNGISVLSSIFRTLYPSEIIDAKIETETFAEIFKRKKDPYILEDASRALRRFSEAKGMTKHIFETGILHLLIYSLRYKLSLLIQFSFI